MLQQTQLWQRNWFYKAKKEASNIYPKQTTNEEKITNAYFHLLFIDFAYFWVISGASLTFSNNQEM